MIKIKTTIPTNFGKTVCFYDENNVKFDSFGWAIVEEKLGKELLIRYESMFLTEQENEAKTKKTAIYEEKAVDTVIVKMQSDIDSLEKRLEEKEGIIKAKEEEIQVWKDKVDELLPQIGKSTEALSEEKITNDKIITELRLEVELAYKTVAQLKSVLESMEVQESKYKDLTKKEDYIKLILAESGK